MRCTSCDKEIGEQKNCPYCGTYNEPHTDYDASTYKRRKKFKIPSIVQIFVLLIAIILTALITKQVDSVTYNKLQSDYDYQVEETKKMYDSLKHYVGIVTTPEWKAYSSLSEYEIELLVGCSDITEEYKELKSKSNKLKESIESLKEKKKVLERTSGIKKGAKKSIAAGEYVVGETFPEGRFKITCNGDSGNVFSDDNYYGDDLNIIISNRSDFGIKEYTHVFTDGERVTFKTSVYIQMLE